MSFHFVLGLPKFLISSGAKTHSHDIYSFQKNDKKGYVRHSFIDDVEIVIKLSRPFFFSCQVVYRILHMSYLN